MSRRAIEWELGNLDYSTELVFGLGRFASGSSQKHEHNQLTLDERWAAFRSWASVYFCFHLNWANRKLMAEGSIFVVDGCLNLFPFSVWFTYLYSWHGKCAILRCQSRPLAIPRDILVSQLGLFLMSWPSYWQKTQQAIGK